MDFEPVSVELKIAQGTHVWRRFRLVTPLVPADRVDGVWISRSTGLPLTSSELNPFDFTGKTIRGAMRKKHTAGAPAPVTPTTGIDFSSTAIPPTARTGPEPGEFAIRFTPATTSPLKATDNLLEADTDGDEVLTGSKWVFDVEMTDDATGEVSRLIYGRVLLMAEVTK